MKNHIEKIVMKTSMDNLKTYIRYDNSERQILEPITTIIKLGILNFKEDGTKLSVSSNTLNFNEPTFVQGVVRYITNSKREDIHYLNTPILNASLMYDISNETIKYLFILAKGGLNKLKEYYSSEQISNTTTHSLELYISYINSFLEGKTTEGNNKTGIYRHFNDLWTGDELNIIKEIFKQCHDKLDHKQYYIESIESILKVKEFESDKIISDYDN
jgi:hypothetical protein